MKRSLVLLSVLLLTVFLVRAQNSFEAFKGMWTLSIEGGSVGWIGVHNDNGFIDAELLWGGGSVVPVLHIYFADDKHMTATRTREIIRTTDDGSERKHVVTQVYEFKRDGDKVAGILKVPAPDGLSVRETRFSGWKLPDVPPAPDLASIKYGEPVELFNGKDLSGWHLVESDRTNGFKVNDGVLVNDPPHTEGGHSRSGNFMTERKFHDFNLSIEVNVPKGSNSGVYLRAMYEIQVFDSYGKEPDSHNMGALYSRITPSVAAEKPAGEWQKMDITLCDRHLTVILNGKKIIDNKPVYGPTGGAKIADVFKPGPVLLQGDHGKVSFRNIILRPIIKDSN